MKEGTEVLVGIGIVGAIIVGIILAGGWAFRGCQHDRQEAVNECIRSGGRPAECRLSHGDGSQ